MPGETGLIGMFQLGKTSYWLGIRDQSAHGHVAPIRAPWVVYVEKKQAAIRPSLRPLGAFLTLHDALRARYDLGLPDEAWVALEAVVEALDDPEMALVAAMVAEEGASHEDRVDVA